MLTDEQQDILDTIVQDDVTLLKVSAVSGAGKTSTLIEVSKLFSGKQLYLAYNKAIATEAASKFGEKVMCKTTHSLAYNPVVTQGLSNGIIPRGKRKVDWFGWKNITEAVNYETKLEIIEAMDAFFLSSAVSMVGFFKDYPAKISAIAKSYITKMAKKEIPCTHSFYLKYYHILLAKGVITHVLPYDLIMLDEAGDINPVTLEIFKLLPAKKKIIVGDPQQNIYSFNNTINGFVALADHGVQKTLTKSFRCSENIANRVEAFCIENLDPNMHFRGTNAPDNDIKTRAVIARTNGTLVATMIKLNTKHVKFNTTRPAKEIFNLLLILIGLKPGAQIFDKRYKHLLDDMNNYYASEYLQKKYSSLIGYIGAEHSMDIMIKSAVTTLLTHGGRSIIQAYELAKAYEGSKVKHDLTLTTAHSSKGLEWDRVTLAEDMSVADILEKPKDKRKPEEIEELRLYYVACTRAVKDLVNATDLPQIER